MQRKGATTSRAAGRRPVRRLIRVSAFVLAVTLGAGVLASQSAGAAPADVPQEPQLSAPEPFADGTPAANDLTRAGEEPQNIWGRYARPTFTVAAADSTRTASGTVPGDFGGIDVSLEGDGRYLSPLVRKLSGRSAGTVPESFGPSAATKDCLYNGGRSLPAGTIKDCNHTSSVTLKFERPQINPVMVFTLNANGNHVPGSTTVQPDDGAWMAWQNVRITSVNDSPPDAGRVASLELAGGPASTHGGAGLDWGDVPGLPWDVNRSVGITQSNGALLVKGAVAELTITMSDMAAVTTQRWWFGNRVISDIGQAGPIAIWPFLGATNLQVVKSAPDVVAPGGQLSWDIEVDDSQITDDATEWRLFPGTPPEAVEGSHGLIVKDAVPESVTDVAIVSAPEGCTLSGRDLDCRKASPGWTVQPGGPEDKYASLVGGDEKKVIPPILTTGNFVGKGESLRVTLTGKAPTTPGTRIVNTATVTGVDIDLDLTNNSSSASTVVGSPTWGVQKAVALPGDKTYAAPGDLLDYTVTATSSAGAVEGVTIDDDLSEVLTNARFVAGSASLKIGDGAATRVPDPRGTTLSAGPFDLPAGGTAQLSYRVRVGDDAWSSRLRNLVTASGGSTPDTCATGTPPADVCTTTTVTTARIEIVKRGTVNGQVALLDGAAFEVLADDAGVPGEKLAGVSVAAVAGKTGRFEVTGIAPGSYWLREVRAPAGHSLLAQPARFAVAETGAVSLVDAAADGVVSVDDNRLAVTDSPAFDLPETGGSGSHTVFALGLVLVGIASGCAMLRHRRRGTSGSAGDAHLHDAAKGGTRPVH